MRRLLSGLLLGLVVTVGLAAPVNAYTRSATIASASSSAHFVYNCHALHPTVEIDLSNVSGAKDVYVQNDMGYYLIAQNFTFDPTKVYDGLYAIGLLNATDVFLTDVGVGPYDEDSRIAESRASGFACPYWGDVDYVYPAPPAGSVPIEFAWIAKFRND
jgi:hypothetical protein